MISQAFTFMIPLCCSPPTPLSDGAVSFREFIKVLIAYMAFDDDATAGNDDREEKDDRRN